MGIIEKVHDLVSPWVGTHPIITIITAFAVGIILGVAIKSKKKKD